MTENPARERAEAQTTGTGKEIDDSPGALRREAMSHERDRAGRCT